LIYLQKALVIDVEKDTGSANGILAIKKAFDMITA